jgi:hypothetical protein
MSAETMQVYQPFSYLLWISLKFFILINRPGVLNLFCIVDQSRINIGSDGTLAGAPVWMGLKRGPQFIFWGHYLFKHYKTEYKVQKNMGITCTSTGTILVITKPQCTSSVPNKKSDIIFCFVYAENE